MRKNKFVKLIEHILVMLPLVFVGTNALYTIFNQNATENYSDFEVQSVESVDSITEFSIGTVYYATGDNPNGAEGRTTDFYYSSISVDWEYILDTTLDYDIDGFSIHFYASGDIYRLYLHDSTNNTWRNFSLIPNKQYLFDNFYFVLSQVPSNFNLYFLNLKFYIFTFGKLNQILEYSMERFNEFGFNKIPFTSFFVNIFHNGDTNVYIDFVNNYLNYMLFVECCYFVPMVLYWFIHLGEDVLDKFTRKGDKL